MTTTDRPSGSEDLREFPGYLLAQVYHMVRHAMDTSLREIGLTAPQWMTLKCILENEHVSGADLARMHHRTPQTMNTILQNLEHAELIRREHHPSNGTVLVLGLTELGRQRMQEALQRVQTVQELMLADLNPDERGLLVELLDRCAVSLARNGNNAALWPDE